MDKIQSSFDSKKNIRAFFSSRMTLTSLRRDIFDLGQKIGHPVYIYERLEESTPLHQEDEIQSICLSKVRESDNFVCVLDGTYGKPCHQTEISILELEIFMAALSGKDMYIFLLDPFEPDIRLQSLLRTIEIACPKALDPVPKNERKIKGEIERCLSKKLNISLLQRAIESSKIIKLFVQFLARLRFKKDYRYKGDIDLHFLNNEFAGLYNHDPDKNLVKALLNNTELENNLSNKLVYLWTVIRHLCAVPFYETENKNFIDLWEITLSRWASAAAWYGLHGHLYLGRLAAVNSLLEIKHIIKDTTADTNIDQSIQGTRGAIASEYYSIAKRVLSPWYKRTMLKKALWNIECALSQNFSDRSGFYAIRANIFLNLYQINKAIGDFKNVLNILMVDGEKNIGRIGEVKVDLGFAYFYQGKIRLARSHLQEGVSILNKANRPEFLVRALRKLCIFYLFTLDRKLAFKIFKEAYEKAIENHAFGQLQQLSGLIKFFPTEKIRTLEKDLRWNRLII